MTSRQERLAIELASMSDAFEDDEAPETVIRTVLEAQLDALSRREEARERKQAELKADILGDDYDDSDAPSEDTDNLSEAEAEQKRLKNEILDD